MADDDSPAAEPAEPYVEDKQDVLTDRRRQERTKVEVKRTFLGSIEQEMFSETPCHLHLLDISEGGMKVNVDQSLEPESQVCLRFALNSLSSGMEGDFESLCRVVWVRPTPGGTVTGLEFKELKQDSPSALQRLLEIWSEKSSLDLTRLWKPVNAKLRNSDEDAWSKTVFVQALSPSGFQFKSSEPMEKDLVCQSRLLLTGGPLVTSAMVRWCKPISDRSFDVGFQFVELSDTDEASIRLHLKRTGNASFRK